MTPPTLLAAPAQGAAGEAARLSAATGRAFAAFSAAKIRHPHDVGISSLGGCRRRLAYGLAKVPISNVFPPGQDRAANLGTMEHTGLLPHLAAELPGARTEVAVTVHGAGLTLPGHIDLDTPEDTIDLKTVGEWRLNGARYQRGAYYNHRLQVGGYALGRLQEGRPTQFVSWLYLDRASGDEYVITEDFSNGLALEVVDRLDEVARYVREDPHAAPRDEPGPGRAFSVCNDCPWLNTCWGPDARPHEPVQAVTDVEVEGALLDYVEARDMASRGKAGQKAALERLEQVRYGTYGSVSYGRGKGGEVPDDARAVAKLRRLGLDVPMTTKRGAVQVKLVGPNPRAGVTS